MVDKEDHASIVDGCLMSYGEMRRFSHNDISSLEVMLSRLPESAGKLVVVDGVYSMGGDIAPLPEIVPICKKYGARIMVDDAHSIGVLGNGRGTAAHFGLEDQVDIIMGTFSKSFASVGGFITASKDVLHYIQHHARALMFSASLPPANAATVLACLDIIEEDPSRIDKLWDNADYMRTNLKRLGFNTGRNNTPIIPIIIGDDLRTVLTWKALAIDGVYTNPVLPPGVPPNMSLLRTSYTATHTPEHLDKALPILEAVGRRRDDAYYLNLPEVPSNDPQAQIWRLRRRTFAILTGYVMHTLKHNSERWALDLGAGNCWLSYRLALSGYHVLALDVNVEGQDGLSGGEVFLRSGGSSFLRGQAS